MSKSSVWTAVGSLGALSLLACTAEPRYPITMGQGLGEGGVSVIPPRYPIASPPGAQGPTSTAAAPSVAASPAPGYAPPAASSSDDGPPPRAAPTDAIEAQPLGPTGPQAARSEIASGGPSERPAAPPRSALETPREIQVQPFETVYDVAERLRTPLRALVDLNGLKPPYALTAGQILRAPQPVIYTVVEGDTLFGVSRRFSIDPRSLANLNDLALETEVRAGQRLALPPLVRDNGVNPQARGVRPAGLGAETRYAAAPARGGGQRPPADAEEGAADRQGAEPLPPRPPAPAVSETEIAALGRGKFIWPVRGEILSRFGPKGPGQRNDGVNIAAAPGETVRAAAGGVVVYAGNSIPAFGNLVLIKHPGGWATLYGNLGKIKVNNNAAVSQGQEVGVAGLSGAVDRSQVHFEIRYAEDPHDKAKPYDPATLLPSG